MLRGMECKLLFGQGQCALGVLTRLVEPAAVNGDQSDREMVLGNFEPVLDRDVVRLLGKGRRELPPACPELDPGEPPERTGRAWLIAVPPLPVLAFEELARLLAPVRRCQGVGDSQGRLLHELLAADSRRELLRTRREVIG